MSTRTAQPQDRLLTAQDLSEITGLSVSTIYRRRSLGESLPAATRLGGNAVRWRRQDVDEWIESCREEN